MLGHVEREGSDGIKRCQANGLLKYFHTFDFVFYLQLMLLILGLTNNISKALQNKDQDILNTISLVKSTKQQLCKLRDNGWDSVIRKVNSFFNKHNTELLIMEDEFIDPKKPRKRSNITNLHYYQIECFYTVLDMQIREFNDLFDEINTELLGCTASLSPIDSFHLFDQSKLVRLSEFILKILALWNGCLLSINLVFTLIISRRSEVCQFEGSWRSCTCDGGEEKNIFHILLFTYF